jgi:hypothetical protein
LKELECFYENYGNLFENINSFISKVDFYCCNAKNATENCYTKPNIVEKNAYEDKNYRYKSSQIWKRQNYEYKYCNDVVNLDYKKQYCIVGVNTFYNQLENLKTLYEDKTNDFILLDNKENSEKLCNILDENNFSEMKCYSMTDCNETELIQYFKMLYKSCDDYSILYNPETQTKTENLPENATKIEINIDSNWNVSYSSKN